MSIVGSPSSELVRVTVKETDVGPQKTSMSKELKLIQPNASSACYASQATKIVDGIIYRNTEMYQTSLTTSL